MASAEINRAHLRPAESAAGWQRADVLSAGFGGEEGGQHPGTIGLGQHADCRARARARRRANAGSKETVERNPGRAAKPRLRGADIAGRATELQVERAVLD